MKVTIVFGVPRSGTTFLMSVLEAMPDTECVQGHLFAPAIPQVFEQELPETIRDALLTAFSTSIREYLSSGMYNARTAALRKWLATRDGIPGLIRCLRSERHAERFVYKEPFLAFSPSYVFEALPQARIISIYRDGRDVADSLVRTYDVLTDAKLARLTTNEAPLGRRYADRYVPWWVDEAEDRSFLAASPYVRAIWMWREMVRRCHDYLSRPDVRRSGRTLLVRYEDFVRDPAVIGTEIAAHVGGPLTKRMLHRLRQAHTASIGIHARRDSEEIRDAEAIAGPELELLGYTLSPKSDRVAPSSSGVAGRDASTTGARPWRWRSRPKPSRRVA